MIEVQNSRTFLVWTPDGAVEAQRPDLQVLKKLDSRNFGRSAKAMVLWRQLAMQGFDIDPDIDVKCMRHDYVMEERRQWGYVWTCTFLMQIRRSTTVAIPGLPNPGEMEGRTDPPIGAIITAPPGGWEEFVRWEKTPYDLEFVRDAQRGSIVIA